MTVLLLLLALYVAAGVALAVAGYRQHAVEVRARHAALTFHRGPVYATAAVAAGAVVAVLIRPATLAVSAVRARVAR